jgi:hypothetical protein
MANPTLADFKALGASLPPSSKISSPEVADILGAVIAYVEYGKAIFEAPAKQGGVYQFLHDAISKIAEANGDPQPQKGQQLTNPAAVAPVQTQTAAPIDYDQLAAAMLKAQQAHEASQVAPVAPNVESVETGDNVEPESTL